MALNPAKRLIPGPLKVLWWRWNDGTLPEKLSWKARAMRRAVFGERSKAKLPYVWEGKPLRWSLIQAVIDKYGFKSYLEIGCDGNGAFDNVRCDRKVGVDPAAGGTVRKTSDAFFAVNTETFDCVFIDGLHQYEQVKRDIDNSLAALSDGGIILLHDCIPCNIREQAVPREQVHWSGDVWKAIVERRTQTHIDTAVCAIDRGVGVILKRANTDLLSIPHRDFKRLTFKEYATKHVQWMRPKDYDATLQFIEGEA